MATEYRRSEEEQDDEQQQRLREFGLLGHAEALTVIEGSEPSRKRRIGFVTEDEYVRGGVVKQYKSRRSPKRAKRRKR